MYLRDTARIVCHTLQSFGMVDEQGIGKRTRDSCIRLVAGRYGRRLDTPERYVWSSNSMNFPMCGFLGTAQGGTSKYMIRLLCT
jgi:hypothetical protein